MSTISRWTSGPGCSKLTTSLVNVSLNLQTLISQICQFFFVEKMWEAFAMQKLLSFFSTKNFSVFGYKVVKHLTTWPFNKIIKLTMLWTTGPRSLLVSSDGFLFLEFARQISNHTGLTSSHTNKNGIMLYEPGAHFTKHLKPKIFVHSIQFVWNLRKS